jgi:SAM-dependent methyltransferase
VVHRTAIHNAKLFHDVYVQRLSDVHIVELGSQNVNGTIRDSFDARLRYTGVDFVAGKGVDVVLDDPYQLPFEGNSIDVIVSSSVFEHSEFFWLTFMEMVRVLKPGGLIYINAPSNGPVHRYPVDCWRFYPDSGRALANWAVRQGEDVVLLESYLSEQNGGPWNDFVAVFLKDASKLEAHPNRILTASGQGMTNGYVHGRAEAVHPQTVPEDQRALLAIQQFVQGRLKPL